MSVRIRVSLPAQHLELRQDNGKLLARYPVSTAAKGAGEQCGSYQTPRGKHLVRARIGAGQPVNAVFVGRRPTGEIWTPELGRQQPTRDWILTRILWLSGCQPGFNRLGAVDSMRRYIYLHGTAEIDRLGQAASHGCIRLDNADIIELFDRVALHTPVNIVEFQLHSGSWAALQALAWPVREQVFVHEQGVPLAMEVDQFDPLSVHVIARSGSGETIGTGRLLPDGHIGRLAVLPAWRGRGVGQALLDALLDAADERGMKRLLLHAQTQAVDFYTSYGFAPSGVEFLEAGIAHRLMTRG